MKERTVAALRTAPRSHGTHLSIVAGEVKRPSSYTEQTKLNTNLFNITHPIICFTILLNLIVKVLGKK